MLPDKTYSVKLLTTTGYFGTVPVILASNSNNIVLSGGGDCCATTGRIPVVVTLPVAPGPSV